MERRFQKGSVSTKPPLGAPLFWITQNCRNGNERLAKVSDLTGPGTEPASSRADSIVLNHYAKWQVSAIMAWLIFHFVKCSKVKKLTKNLKKQKELLKIGRILSVRFLVVIG